MAIDSIGSSALTQQLSSTSSSVAGAGRDADGDNDNSGGAGRAAGGSPVASAIAQALTSIGVSAQGGTDASGAAKATGSDPQQAAHAFTQALFAALHGQEKGASGSGAQHAGGGHHRHGGGAGKVESGLQNLIQQLGASSSSANTSTSTSDNSTLSKLQSAFDSLVSANGGQPGSASLGSFLQSMQQNLHAAPASGNVVNTSA